MPLLYFWRPTLSLSKEPDVQKRSAFVFFFVFAFVFVPLFDFWRPTISLPKELGVQKRSVYCIVEDTVAQDQECDFSERPADTRVCPRCCVEHLMRILFSKKGIMVIVTVLRMMIMMI